MESQNELKAAITELEAQKTRMQKEIDEIKKQLQYGLSLIHLTRFIQHYHSPIRIHI